MAKAVKRKSKPKAKPISLHPLIDKGAFGKAKANFAGGTLSCRCASDPVAIHVKGQTAHNHACGCSKCWKPAGAMFSIIAVTPRENISVAANGHKLRVVDANAPIQRHACSDCGTHMFGRIENTRHAFHGLDFVHTELSKDKGWTPPAFAAFVSSVIETGTDPAQMAAIRARCARWACRPTTVCHRR